MNNRTPKADKTDLNNGAMRARPENHAKGDQLNGWWNTPLPRTEPALEDDEDLDGAEDAA